MQWLLFGMKPSRARLYDFRDRIAPFLAPWNAQVLQVAVEENLTPEHPIFATFVASPQQVGHQCRPNEEKCQAKS